MLEISLGTAQFGADYGISNDDGQVSEKNAYDILKFASINGINTLDTSYNYGNSEQVLGRIVNHTNWKVITKTKKFQNSAKDLNNNNLFFESFEESLLNLNAKNIYGLLVHESEELLSIRGENLFNNLSQLRSIGLVKKIGASIYNANQIEKILSSFDIDIIQLPLSLFDQRLVEGGYIRELQKRNIEIHVRSIFLQGLALMSLDKINSFFNPILPKIKLLNRMEKRYSMSKLEIALNYIKTIDGISSAVIGVTSVKQLNEVLKARSKQKNNDILEYPELSISQSKFVNPSQWQV